MTFGSPEWMSAWWTVPLLAAAIWWSLRRSMRSLRCLVGDVRAKSVLRSARPMWRAVLIIVALTAIIAGLSRPRWDPTSVEAQATGRDICIIFDVSRSMLAADLSPNRLERAKLWVRDLMGSLDGDRVAIVAFAGTAVVKCPLTTDYGFFRLALDELGPSSVSRGGTLIGDAIRKALDEVFIEEDARGRDIILITDGGDHESFPIDAASRARDKGVRIIALGLGSDSVGAVVPGARVGETPVTSRLDARGLAQIASASDDGVYLHVADGEVDLEEVHRDLIATAAKSEVAMRESMVYREGFQIPLAAALAILVFETFVGGRRRGHGL